MPIEAWLFSSFTGKIVKENGTRAQKKNNNDSVTEKRSSFIKCCAKIQIIKNKPFGKKTNFWITTMFPKVAKHIGETFRPAQVYAG